MDDRVRRWYYQNISDCTLPIPNEILIMEDPLSGKCPTDPNFGLSHLGRKSASKRASQIHFAVRKLKNGNDKKLSVSPLDVATVAYEYDLNTDFLIRVSGVRLSKQQATDARHCLEAFKSKEWYEVAALEKLVQCEEIKEVLNRRAIRLHHEEEYRNDSL